jgi:DNA replication and repair protein RecF
MHLKYLQLINFKNYADVQLDLSPRINVMVGTNGSGKTNLLDAIHYLSLTKSAFTSTDNYAIRHGEKFFSVKGIFNSGSSSNEVLCTVQAGAKKIVRDGVKEYQKLSEHIGRFPVIMIAPDDTALVKEGSEDRRRFFDSIIAQLDRTYLEALIDYNHGLKQRNGLLRLFAETNSFDALALDSYDAVMIRHGELIHQKRAQFVDAYRPVFKKFYRFIVENEQADVEYDSDLKKGNFLAGLQKSRERDIYLQRSNFGIHRDDYLFSLGNGELKRLGSQGQQKSFIIALKLSQFEIIKDRKGIRPILLLDDIFDKLDDERIAKLLQMIREDLFGQLFITDARPDRTSSLLDEIKVKANFYTVANGLVVKNEQ